MLTFQAIYQTDHGDTVTVKAPGLADLTFVGGT